MIANCPGFKWIQFDVTAAEAEALFVAEFFIWEHVSGAHDVSTEEYHVPTHIQEHIDYVTPGTRLRHRSIKVEQVRGLEKRVVAKPLITQLPGFPNPNASTCDIYVTAECTRGISSSVTLYDI
jgi:tripeptidyl-peptidase-1